MKESYLFEMTFNNVVFATRNKSYGAYQLRRDYSKHMVTAAILATSIFGVSIAWPLLVPKQVTVVNGKSVTEDDERIVKLDQTILLPPPPPQQEQPAKALTSLATEQQIKTIRNPTPVVVPDSHKGPDEVPPKQQEMAGALIGTQNIDGALTSSIDLSGIDGSGTGVSDSEAPSTIFEYAEEMPAFGDGDRALMNYISKKIKYPRQAVDEKIEGTVIVSFVVNRYGQVKDVTVLKGLGYGTDEEASRVIRNMPDWAPGKQNGQPVAVRYTLPIRFNLQR